MNNDFAKTLRRLRLRKGMTQEQVAELAGINPKYLGEIERGLKSPTVGVVRNLADALAVPVCLLLSTQACPCKDNNGTRDIAMLLAGKRGKEVRKVIKLIKVIFE